MSFGVITMACSVPRVSLFRDLTFFPYAIISTSNVDTFSEQCGQVALLKYYLLLSSTISLQIPIVFFVQNSLAFEPNENFNYPSLL